MKLNQKVDQYIANSKPFAQPILNHLRKLIHNACPEVEETIKWQFPFYVYKGSNLCDTASFKSHCSMGFWLAVLMKDPHKVFIKGENRGMGNFGKLESLDDLPSDQIILEYLQEAMDLIDAGKKLPRKDPSTRKKLVVPDYFQARLDKNLKALATFENFSYTNKKDYIEWITEAKTEATREKRIETTLEWLEEGKIRNWKYVKK